MIQKAHSARTGRQRIALAAFALSLIFPIEFCWADPSIRISPDNGSGGMARLDMRDLINPLRYEIQGSNDLRNWSSHQALFAHNSEVSFPMSSSPVSRHQFYRVRWESAEPDNLDTLLETIRNQYDLPALAALVIHQGRIAGQGATGLARLDDDRRVHIDNRWHFGSIGKSMTALGIAMLVGEGTLSLEATLPEIFPEIPMHEDWRTATVADLVWHTAGFDDSRFATDPAFAQLSGTFGEQRLQAARILLAASPAYEPGTQWNYANGGYAIAGAVIERVTGVPFESFIEEQIFVPLEMESAGFLLPAGEGRRNAEPWGHVGQVPLDPDDPESELPGVLSPAGLMHASIGDYAKYVALHLAGARGESAFLPPELFETLHQHADPVNGTYAFGWVRGLFDGSLGPGTLFHDGSNESFHAYCLIAPTADFAVIAVTNREESGASSDALTSVIEQAVGRYLQ